MAEVILMPRQGQSVESCIIGEWYKKKGDTVSVGDKLFNYETDKATFDEEAQVEGKLLAVFFGEGDDVPVLTNVCVIGKDGEDWKQFIPAGATQVEGAKSKEVETVTQRVAPEALPIQRQKPEITMNAVRPSAPTRRMAPPVAISPRARAAAEKRGADLNYAEPSGPNGRVIERDVNRLIREGYVIAADAAPFQVATMAAQSSTASTALISESDYSDEKVPQIRKLIAKAMHESVSSMAQLTLNASFDISNIVDFRDELKEAVKSGIGEKMRLSLLEHVPTINDIILFVVSRIVLKHPDANAHFFDDTIRRFHHVQLGVAVDTPRGLMVPVVRNADLKSIDVIATEVRRLAADAQSGTINPDEIRGGSITVTNLGGLGIEHFTPIINPPETCILGVNTIKTAIREEDDCLVAYPAMQLSLTIDHRAWDGAPAARFLTDVCQALENFTLFLMSDSQ